MNTQRTITSLKHTRIICYLALLALFLLAGCSNATTPPASNGPDTSTCLGNCVVGTGVQNVHIFVEPDAGESVITGAIASAHRSVWLEIYLLSDRKVMRALEEAAHRGIDVRVMIEQNPYGGGPSTQQVVDELLAAGARAQFSSPKFALTHEKGMIIDGSTAYIMTANFTRSALGGSSGTANREYGIIDTNPQDVQAVSAIFTADWNRTVPQINNANLVVSPINSRYVFLSLIQSAHKTLLIEAEELLDSNIEQAIAQAAKKGIQVQVILPQFHDNAPDHNAAGVDVIKQGGAQVKEDPQLYMHAKIMIVDGQKAFVGSENISSASLDGNRELGILVSNQMVLTTLQQTFQQDWNTSVAS